jgi:hypothetical protein
MANILQSKYAQIQRLQGSFQEIVTIQEDAEMSSEVPASLQANLADMLQNRGLGNFN